MRKIDFIRVVALAVVLTIGCVGFLLTPKSEMQVLNAIKTPQKVVDGLNEVKGYQNWTKVSQVDFKMDAAVAIACAVDVRKVSNKGSDIENSPHKDKYINVYVNSIGKMEMLTKKNPQFPVGTVVVKEKLTSPESRTPELLTVMIKRTKDFNPKLGDWEFMTLNGQATEVTAKGRLARCASCHLEYKQNDYITRTYLPDEFRQKLK